MMWESPSHPFKEIISKGYYVEKRKKSFSVDSPREKLAKIIRIMGYGARAYGGERSLNLITHGVSNPTLKSKSQPIKNSQMDRPQPNKICRKCYMVCRKCPVYCLAKLCSG
jgi:hypothetical protein